MRPMAKILKTKQATLRLWREPFHEEQREYAAIDGAFEQLYTETMQVMLPGWLTCIAHTKLTVLYSILLKVLVIITLNQFFSGYAVEANGHWRRPLKQHLCNICAMKDTFNKTQEKNQQPFVPNLIHDNLKEICSTMNVFYEEDAYEFLVKLLENMDTS